MAAAEVVGEKDGVLSLMLDLLGPATFCAVPAPTPAPK